MFHWHPLLAFSLLLSNSCIAGTTTPNSRDDLGLLVSDVAGGGLLSRQKLERVFQATFTETQGTKYLRVFEAKSLRYGALKLERVSYIEPLPAANFGPRITVTLSGKCLQRDLVLSQFRSLTITETPNGHSVNEETVFSRDYLGGNLSFGFAEAAPDCLRSITIAQPK